MPSAIQINRILLARSDIGSLKNKNTCFFPFTYQASFEVSRQSHENLISSQLEQKSSNKPYDKLKLT